MELNETDLGLLDVRGPTGRLDDRLVQDDAGRQLGIIDRAADFLHDPDVAQIDVVCDRRVDDVQHRVDRDRRQ